LEDAIVEHPLVNSVTDDFSILQSAQAAIVGADPDTAIAIDVERTNIVTRQAIAFSPANKLSILYSRQSTVAANPEFASRSLDHYAHVVGRKPITRRQLFRRAVFQGNKACRGAKPDRSLSILEHRLDNGSRGKSWLGRPIKFSVTKGTHAAMGCHPKVALPIFEKGSREFSRKIIGNDVVRKPSICKTAHAGVPCADPHRAGMVLIDRVNVAVDQTLFFGIGLNGLRLEAQKALALGSQPEILFAVFIERRERDGVGLSGREILHRSRKAMSDANRPSVSVTIGVACGSVRVQTTRGLSIRGDAGAFTIDSFDPDRSSLVACCSPDRFAGQPRRQCIGDGLPFD